MDDRDVWHFTNNGKYIVKCLVKSAYQVERVYTDREKLSTKYEPTIDSLKAFCWKIRCSPKIKHFLWQLLTGCIAVKKNLPTRGIQGDICYARCEASEESINHVLFLMSSGGSSLCILKDLFESGYFFFSTITFRKYGLAILEIFSQNG